MSRNSIFKNVGMQIQNWLGKKTDVEAVLAAGIFHREEVPIEAVKDHMRDEGIETR